MSEEDGDGEDYCETTNTDYCSDTEAPSLVAQGAEARVYKTVFLGRPTIVKERFAKKYRVAELDTSLRLERHRNEIRCLARARQAGVRVPTLYHADAQTFRIYMEHVDGTQLKQYLVGLSSVGMNDVLGKLGSTIGLLHSTDIIHGDLTTSNFVVEPDTSLALIDFGLAHVSASAEDKAVDLYVLERAIVSTHATDSSAMVQRILNAYAASMSKKCKAVTAKLDEVRARGRKREMIG